MIQLSMLGAVLVAVMIAAVGGSISWLVCRSRCHATAESHSRANLILGVLFSVIAVVSTINMMAVSYRLKHHIADNETQFGQQVNCTVRFIQDREAHFELERAALKARVERNQRMLTILDRLADGASIAPGDPALSDLRDAYRLAQADDAVLLAGMHATEYPDCAQLITDPPK